MKKELFLICLFLSFLSFSCQNQYRNESDLMRENINGQVAVITEKTYDARENYGILESGHQNRTRISKYNLDGNLLYDRSEIPPHYLLRFGDLEYNEENIYDNNGLLIISKSANTVSQLTLVKNGATEKVVEILCKFEYDGKKRVKQSDYDKKGNIQRSIEYNYDKYGKGVFAEIKQYKRESRDNPNEITSISLTTIENQYNKKGQTIKTTYNMPNRTQFELFEFDENGNVTRTILKDEKETADTIISYPPLNIDIDKGIFEIDYSNPIEQINYHNTNITTSFKYDEFGNVVYKEVVDEERSAEERVEIEYFKYKYDDFGNWIEKTNYDAFMQPTASIIRKIEYYSKSEKNRETNKILETTELELEKEYKLTKKKEEFCNENTASAVLDHYCSEKDFIIEKVLSFNLTNCTFRVSFHVKHKQHGRAMLDLEFYLDSETENYTFVVLEANSL